MAVQKITLKKVVRPGDPDTVCAFLSENAQLSKIRIKDAMRKGAVWLKKQKGKEDRIRRATAIIKIGDTLSLSFESPHD